MAGAQDATDITAQPLQPGGADHRGPLAFELAVDLLAATSNLFPRGVSTTGRWRPSSTAEPSFT